MKTGNPQRFVYLFPPTGTRRAALGALIGSGLAGLLGEPAAAVRLPEKRGGARSRKSKKKGRQAEAQGHKKRGNHCIHPDGADLNALYGISAQIVAPPPERGFIGCNKVGAGEQWVNTASWLMAPTFLAEPVGFVRGGETPLEDFRAKFTGVRYVVDPGTGKEKTVFIPTSDMLFVGEDDGLVQVSPGTLGTVHPLPIGPHAFALYWVMSAMHCDGLTDVIEENCLPAGDVLFIPGLTFEVVPGHNA